MTTLTVQANEVEASGHLDVLNAMEARTQQILDDIPLMSTDALEQLIVACDTIRDKSYVISGACVLELNKRVPKMSGAQPDAKINGRMEATKKLAGKVGRAPGTLRTDAAIVETFLTDKATGKIILEDDPLPRSMYQVALTAGTPELQQEAADLLRNRRDDPSYTLAHAKQDVHALKQGEEIGVIEELFWLTSVALDPETRDMLRELTALQGVDMQTAVRMAIKSALSVLKTSDGTIEAGTSKDASPVNVARNTAIPAVNPRYPNGVQSAFEQFHADNPTVLDELRQIALRIKATGVAQTGMKAIAEAVRMEGKFKLDNSFTAHYARLLMATFPELAGFFRVREQKGGE